MVSRKHGEEELKGKRGDGEGGRASFVVSTGRLLLEALTSRELKVRKHRRGGLLGTENGSKMRLVRLRGKERARGGCQLDSKRRGGSSVAGKKSRELGRTLSSARISLEIGFLPSVLTAVRARCLTGGREGGRRTKGRKEGEREIFSLLSSLLPSSSSPSRLLPSCHNARTYEEDKETKLTFRRKLVRAQIFEESFEE